MAMLRRKEGATVAAVMKATGWQKHSVHGFFAGVVRKKLGLNLVSEKTDGTRVYRIVEGKTRQGQPRRSASGRRDAVRGRSQDRSRGRSASIHADRGASRALAREVSI